MTTVTVTAATVTVAPVTTAATGTGMLYLFTSNIIGGWHQVKVLFVFQFNKPGGKQSHV